MKTETSTENLKFSPKNPYVLRFFVGNIHPEGRDFHHFKNGRKVSVPKIFNAEPLVKDLLAKPVPSGNNPRSHPKECTRSPVAREIATTLQEDPQIFGLVNRGALIIADDCHVKDGVMTITLTNPDIHGAADGATTLTVADKIIKKFLENRSLEEVPDDELPEPLKVARVPIKVIAGVSDKECIARIVEGHNTSRQVKDSSLADFRGEFDWLKNHVLESDAMFAGKIGYDENAHGVKILDILAKLYCFHPINDEIIDNQEQAPVEAYSGKGKLIAILENEKLRPGFTNLLPIVKDILLLYEYIHEHFGAAYEAAYNDHKLGRRLGVESFKLAKPEDRPVLPFSGKTLEYEISNALLYPLLSGFRALVTYYKTGENTGKAKWKTNPFHFFDRHRAALIRALIQQIDNQKTPNMAAKNTLPYIALKKEVLLAYGDDLEQSKQAAA